MERTAVTSTAVAAPYFVSARALGAEDKAPANERLRIGLIGCGGMGQSNLSNCAAQADVEVTALCDVWKSRLDLTGKRYPTAKQYHDYRQLLADKNVDGVIIATPPHWHCRQAAPRESNRRRKPPILGSD